ncbi:hypothetical protein [Enterococcus faecium]|nr:hypothetical protein [Enterococcus faecium]
MDDGIITEEEFNKRNKNY